LVGRLARGEREIYVIGPSGSGKSSLVQAGLLHALDAGSSALGRAFAQTMMRPGDRPAVRLARALAWDPAVATAAPTGPGAAIEALVARHPPAERVLVFVDQLEELFTAAGAAELPLARAARRLLRRADGQRTVARSRGADLAGRGRGAARRRARHGDHRA